MDKYIPLIVILVSVVFSIIGKKKKQAVTQETTLPGKTVREYVEEKKVPKPSTVSYQKVSEKNPQKQVFQRQEIKPGKEFEAYSSSSPVMIEPEEDDYSPFHFEEDDIVQAIIYSEIINRKEY